MYYHTNAAKTQTSKTSTKHLKQFQNNTPSSYSKICSGALKPFTNHILEYYTIDQPTTHTMMLSFKDSQEESLGTTPIKTPSYSQT